MLVGLDATEATVEVSSVGSSSSSACESNLPPLGPAMPGPVSCFEVPPCLEKDATLGDDSIGKSTAEVIYRVASSGKLIRLPRADLLLSVSGATGMRLFELVAPGAPFGGLGVPGEVDVSPEARPSFGDMGLDDIEPFEGVRKTGSGGRSRFSVAI